MCAENNCDDNGSNKNSDKDNDRKINNDIDANKNNFNAWKTPDELPQWEIESVKEWIVILSRSDELILNSNDKHKVKNVLKFKEIRVIKYRQRY